MELRVTHNNKEYTVDLKHPFDISIPISGDGRGVQAFGAGRPTIQALEAGSFVGDVKRGGSCNCSTIVITPHCNGTHTESVGHITAEPVYVTEVVRGALFIAKLITIEPELITNGDRVVTLSALRTGIGKEKVSEALIIRTLPNSNSKLTTNYSGTNPAYLEPAAASFIASAGIEHLLLDLPSVDREDDGGKLLAHRAFWNGNRKHCTVTEMVYVESGILDGEYLLDLQIAPILSDAAPSRPLIWPLVNQ